jgi:outer membrane protein TolC
MKRVFFLFLLGRAVGAWAVPAPEPLAPQPLAKGQGQVIERRVTKEEGAKLLDPKTGLKAPVLDLQKAYELALLRSETLGLREQDVRIAEAQYWQALGAILPNVHGLVSNSFSNNNSSSSGSFNSSGNNSGSSDSNSGGSNSVSNSSSNRSNRFADWDQVEARINVKQPIFSGFRDFNTMGAIKATTEANRQTVVRTRQTLYLDVADVFYQILSYERDLGVLEKLQTALSDRAGELDRRIKLGKSRASEQLTAQTDLADARVTVESVKGLLGASKELAAFLTGVPAAELKLSEQKAFPGVEAVEAYLQGSGERPDVLAAVQRERAARKQLAAARGEHFPVISLEGNYFVKEPRSSDREWNFFLTLDVPIFEGGAIEARVRENKALVRQSELNLSQLQRTADKDVRTAYNDFIASVAQFLRLKELVQTSEETYTVQKNDYGRGVSSNLDVLDALRKYEEAERRLLSQEMQARVNLVRLHVAAGRAGSL